MLHPFFPSSRRFAIWEVPREEEFAPLKNAASPAEKDCPTSCRRAFLRYTTRLAIAAGAVLSGVDESSLAGPGLPVTVVEISPEVSHRGEVSEIRTLFTSILKAYQLYL
ncbi:unnamed protein product [Protopolystoma xenopodis]|uniref:Uncharacterized protein n=1 Tax=Protopolystoma xenopodis TaxID=117903 RepID=A0A3S5CGX3_9PLAT|nr:unnamed protein product [Protopolystoma xenopodis]